MKLKTLHEGLSRAAAEERTEIIADYLKKAGFSMSTGYGPQMIVLEVESVPPRGAAYGYARITYEEPYTVIIHGTMQQGQYWAGVSHELNMADPDFFEKLTELLGNIHERYINDVLPNSYRNPR